MPQNSTQSIIFSKTFLKKWTLALLLFLGLYFYLQHTLPNKLKSLADSRPQQAILNINSSLSKALDATVTVLNTPDNSSEFLILMNDTQARHLPFSLIKTDDKNTAAFFDFLPLHGLSTDYVIDNFESSLKNRAGEVILGPNDLSFPTGLVQDAQVVYIADSGAARVVSFDPATKTLQSIVEDLQYPSGLAFHQGDLYIADSLANVVYRYRDGQKEVFAGTGQTGYQGDNSKAVHASLRTPSGLAANDTTLFIADSGNHAIRAVDFKTGIITTIAGGQTPELTPQNCQDIDPRACSLYFPTALSWSNNELLIADSLHHRILSYGLQSVESTLNSYHFFETDSHSQVTREPRITTKLNKVSLPFGLYYSPDQLSFISLDSKKNLQAYLVQQSPEKHIQVLSEFSAHNFKLQASAILSLGGNTLEFIHNPAQHLVQLSFNKDSSDAKAQINLALIYGEE